MSHISFPRFASQAASGRGPLSDDQPTFAKQGRSPLVDTAKRPPTSAAQRAKLSVAQRAYVANDPRWPEHRRRLAAAQEARRMTLFDNEIAAIVAMRRRGRTFSYIAEEIGVCRDVIGRELRARGISTAPVRADQRARRGCGFWRCFD